MPTRPEVEEEEDVVACRMGGTANDDDDDDDDSDDELGDRGTVSRRPHSTSESSSSFSCWSRLHGSNWQRPSFFFLESF